MDAHFPNRALYHLPGLFEFYEFYRIFLPLFREHREYFYDWCEIASIYGAPQDCLWGGGRACCGDADARDVLSLVDEFGISARLTFSNSMLTKEHLLDRGCNALCSMFEGLNVPSGAIVHSDLLADYLAKNYPGLYLVSSTTKVLSSFDDFLLELKRNEFSYVVPDFRLNKEFKRLDLLSREQKNKVEFLCNECCNFFCSERKLCYENVSRRILDWMLWSTNALLRAGMVATAFRLQRRTLLLLALQILWRPTFPWAFPTLS